MKIIKKNLLLLIFISISNIKASGIANYIKSHKRFFIIAAAIGTGGAFIYRDKLLNLYKKLTTKKNPINPAQKEANPQQPQPQAIPISQEEITRKNRAEEAAQKKAAEEAAAQKKIKEEEEKKKQAEAAQKKIKQQEEENKIIENKLALAIKEKANELNGKIIEYDSYIHDTAKVKNLLNALIEETKNKIESLKTKYKELENKRLEVNQPAAKNKKKQEAAIDSRQESILKEKQKLDDLLNNNNKELQEIEKTLKKYEAENEIFKKELNFLLNPMDELFRKKEKIIYEIYSIQKDSIDILKLYSKNKKELHNLISYVLYANKKDETELKTYGYDKLLIKDSANQSPLDKIDINNKKIEDLTLQLIDQDYEKILDAAIEKILNKLKKPELWYNQPGESDKTSQEGLLNEINTINKNYTIFFTTDKSSTWIDNFLKIIDNIKNSLDNDSEVGQNTSRISFIAKYFLYAEKVPDKVNDTRHYVIGDPESTGIMELCSQVGPLFGLGDYLDRGRFPFNDFFTICKGIIEDKGFYLAGNHEKKECGDDTNPLDFNGMIKLLSNNHLNKKNNFKRIELKIRLLSALLPVQGVQKSNDKIILSAHGFPSFLFKTGDEFFADTSTQFSLITPFFINAENKYVINEEQVYAFNNLPKTLLPIYFQNNLQLYLDPNTWCDIQNNKESTFQNRRGAQIAIKDINNIYQKMYGQDRVIVQRAHQHSSETIPGIFTLCSQGKMPKINENGIEIDQPYHTMPPSCSHFGSRATSSEKVIELSEKYRNILHIAAQRGPNNQYTVYIICADDAFKKATAVKI